ncbi:HXT3-Low-affinity hexose facilitator [Fusarium agapanthi]|uniref:HXT3-Low-affinity hexose facilitator n=1 Tax=Fusarium agapanthi TaxID=1803897 RepID=A0A9P5E5Z6_9HYPO|nr:HXT3-Low-affinity hexose facilitator [Fusarium agapanthi]
MPSKTRVYNWFIAMVAASCMTLYGFDSSVFNALQASENWLNWFNLDLKNDSYTVGLINTCYTIGAIVSGFFIAGPLADWLGRRAGMGIGCFITIIAAIIQAFAPKGKLGVFILGRVLIGIGQGTALTAGPVYIGEVSPPEIRGQVMTFWQLFYSVGAFIAYWINFACGKNREKLGEWDWRMVVIFQIMVPIIVIILLPFQPESPRFLIKKGKIDDARSALRSIRDTEEEVEDEVLAIQAAIEYEKEAISPGYRALFKDPSIRKRFGIAVVLNVGQQLTGQGTLNTYSTSIYKQVWTSTEKINLINALWATMGILFTLNAVWTADRFGRRWLFMVGAAGMAVCMLIVPVIGLATPTPKTEPTAIGIVVMLYLFIFFYKPSWGAGVWMWTSEVFSANVRTQAVGMASQCQNVANTIFQQFFPTFLAKTGLKCLFFFFAVNILLVVFVFFFVPETKGISLEHMDTVFGGVDHTEKGAEMLGVDTAQHQTQEFKDGSEIQQSEKKRESV